MVWRYNLPKCPVSPEDRGDGVERDCLVTVCTCRPGPCQYPAPSPDVRAATIEALTAAKQFADDEFSDCDNLRRKHLISLLCDKIDRALALSPPECK